MGASPEATREEAVVLKEQSALTANGKTLAFQAKDTGSIPVARSKHSPLKPHLHAQLPTGAGLAVDPIRQDLGRGGGRPIGTVGLQADLGPSAAGLGGGGLFADQAQDEVDLHKGCLNAA